MYIYMVCIRWRSLPYIKSITWTKAVQSKLHKEFTRSDAREGSFCSWAGASKASSGARGQLPYMSPGHFYFLCILWEWKYVILHHIFPGAIYILSLYLTPGSGAVTTADSCTLSPGMFLGEERTGARSRGRGVEHAAF